MPNSKASLVKCTVNAKNVAGTNHLPEKLIFSKNNFFIFYRNFGFNLEISSYHHSQLKKHLKVDPETKSYDILTKTHQKIPTIPNPPKVCIILGKQMNKLKYFYFSVTTCCWLREVPSTRWWGIFIATPAQMVVISIPAIRSWLGAIIVIEITIISNIFH